MVFGGKGNYMEVGKSMPTESVVAWGASYKDLPGDEVGEVSRVQVVNSPNVRRMAIERHRSI